MYSPPVSVITLICFSFLTQRCISAPYFFILMCYLFYHRSSLYFFQLAFFVLYCFLNLHFSPSNLTFVNHSWHFWVKDYSKIMPYTRTIVAVTMWEISYLSLNKDVHNNFERFCDLEGIAKLMSLACSYKSVSMNFTLTYLNFTLVTKPWQRNRQLFSIGIFPHVLGNVIVHL